MSQKIENVSNSTVVQTGSSCKGISEEQAQELNSVMEEFRKSLIEGEQFAQDFTKSFSACLKNSVELKFIVLIRKLDKYREKFASASFITRWYWKRKMQKILKQLEGVKDILIYLNKETNNEAEHSTEV